MAATLRSGVKMQTEGRVHSKHAQMPGGAQLSLAAHRADLGARGEPAGKPLTPLHSKQYMNT